LNITIVGPRFSIHPLELLLKNLLDV